MVSFLSRYHKLVWGLHDVSESLPSGVLIAGGETGNIILYDPAKIIAGDSEVVITQSDKHQGPVRALDVNSFQVLFNPCSADTMYYMQLYIDETIKILFCWFVF